MVEAVGAETAVTWIRHQEKMVCREALGGDLLWCILSSMGRGQHRVVRFNSIHEGGHNDEESRMDWWLSSSKASAVK